MSLSGVDRGRAFAIRAGEWLACAILPIVVVALPVTAHLVSPLIALALAGLVGVLLALHATFTVPATLLGAYLFQNAVVATISPALDGPDDFNRVRAYNFVLTVAIWLTLVTVAWVNWRTLPRTVRQLLVATFIPLIFVGVYLVVGLLIDPRSAVVYLRNVVTPTLLFQACLVAAVLSPGALQRTLLPIGALAIAYGYAELLWRDGLYGLLNMNSYLALRAQQEGDAAYWVAQMQETGRVMRSMHDAFRVTLFNTPLLSDFDIELYRLLGPNSHSISYAYALTFFSLMFVCQRRFLMGLAAVPLILFIGSKGAVIALVLVIVGCSAGGYLRRPVLMGAFVVVVAAYVGAALVIGMQIGDYHVLGFWGGVNGFLQNPIGHGLGAGGNLSAATTRIDWSHAQQVGATGRAVESAVGVLLFQMGVASVVVLGGYAVIARASWRAAAAAQEHTSRVAAFGILVLLGNAVLQEEALFAPLAMGSFVIAAALRIGAAEAVRGAAPVTSRSVGREASIPKAALGLRAVRPRGLLARRVPLGEQLQPRT
jgi:hypothetical protein